MKVADDQASSEERYFPWFDWLRGILAVIVMLAHGRVLGWPHAGNFAVQVFFALSGWLIGALLLHTPRADLPRFYFNRAVRIWAPYYVALALLVAASLLRDPVTGKWLEFVFYKLTFVYNLFGPPQLATHVAQMPLRGTGNHFWSVNAEEQFYLLAPLLLVLAAPAFGRGRVTWLTLSLLAWTSQFGASIIFGVTAAVLAFHDEQLFRRPLARVLLAVLGIGAALGLATGGSYYVLVPVVSICIVLLLAVPGRRQWLGAIAGGMSYPLYLNHWIGVFVTNALFRRVGMAESVVAHLLSNVLNVGIAVALYMYIDRPLLRSRAAWYTPVLGKRAVIAAYSMIGIGLAIGIAVRLASSS